MNRGLVQSSPVQQMMTGNPTWWNINSMRPPNQPTTPFFSAPSNSFPPYAATSSFNSSIPSWNEDQDQLPESWSQLLMGGLLSEETKVGMGQFQSKKLENWGGILFSQAADANMVNIKQENSGNSYSYGLDNHELQAGAKRTWSQTMSSVSSPNSCVTGFSSNLLDFANKTEGKTPPPADLSSECNSTAAGGAGKKPRVQPTSSTTQTTTFKVRKEKLGDRITTLHQLVSPFGKTDTASVLLEAIGYIRFLQSQIEALSLPYLGSGSAKMRQQQSVQGERINCVFSEDPGQDPREETKKDLRSRGLCLVPISCTLQVGSDNGADYWAPALGGGFR